MANAFGDTEKGVAFALAAILAVPLLLAIASGVSGSPAPTGMSPRGDCLFAPGVSADILALRARGSPEPGFNDTSEFMIGDLSVGLVFLESNGTIDPKTETWTDPMKTSVLNEVEAGVTWWATNPLGPQFNVTVHATTVNTSYEPINRPQSDEGLWIDEAMTQLGYSSGDYFNKTMSYINDMRASDGYDWGYVIFMVNSLNDVDGSFSNGYFAYSYVGGPFTVETYDNDGWGILRMNQVTAHEMGHIFYATDEYDGIHEFSGYLDSLEIEGSGCIMDTGSLSISAGTLHQIGWYDSDGDGVFDIVDTEPQVTLTSVPQEYSNASLSAYSGTATVIPYPNRNPQGPGNNVTVAKISMVYYNVDGSGWMTSSPSDGAFDHTTEAFNFSFAVADGLHSVSVRALTNYGVFSNTFATDDFHADRTAPSSSALDLPSYTNSTAFTIQGDASDLSGLGSVELWYSKDGGTYSLYSTLFGPPWQWSFISSMTGGDGAYDVYTIATDVAGNRESPPGFADTTTIVDTTKPTSIVAPLLALSSSSVIEVFASASDPVGIASVELWYLSPGENWRMYGLLDSLPWHWSFDTAHFGGDGTYEFFTRATDNAGNSEDYRSSTPDASTMRDTIAPVTSATLTGLQSQSGWFRSAVGLSLSSIDQTSGSTATYYRIDSGFWTAYSATIGLTAEGVHSVEYYSQDNAGNAEGVQTVSVEIDRTGPVTGILSAGTLGTNGWFDSGVTIGLEANDTLSGPAKTYYRFGTGDFAEFRGLIGDITDGLYTFECYSVDLAGNSGTHSFLYLKVDSTAPSILNVTYPSHATGSSVAISWAGRDDLSGVDHYEVIVDGGPRSDVGSLAVVQLDLKDGTHTITIIAIDSAGNEATSSISITVDTSLLSTGGPAGPWLDIGAFCAIIAGALLAVFLLMGRGKKKDRNGGPHQQT